MLVLGRLNFYGATTMEEDKRKHWKEEADEIWAMLREGNRLLKEHIAETKERSEKDKAEAKERSEKDKAEAKERAEAYERQLAKDRAEDKKDKRRRQRSGHGRLMPR